MSFYRCRRSRRNYFEALIGTKVRNTLELGWDKIESYLQSSKIHEHIKQELNQVVNLSELSDDNLSDILDKISEVAGTWLNSVGVEFVYGDVGSYINREDMRQISCDWSEYADDNEIDYEILLALGLIQRVDTGFMLIDRFEFTFEYYHITPLGVGFARACKIVEGELKSHKPDRG